jgi:hypothetical protein
MPTLKNQYPFITHNAEPLYLANGTFGGFQDGSATQMDLWSSSIGSRNQSDPDNPVLYPVTALHTAVWFRSAHYQEHDFWIGRDGLVTTDTRYTAHPSMPHLPQVYHVSHQLDMDTGIAECEGVLYPGSQAGLEAGRDPERRVPYQVRTVFLIESGLMMMRIRTPDPETEILFSPDFCLEENLQLSVSGRGICRIGSQIDCDMRLQKELVDLSVNGATIDALLLPFGSERCRVRIDAEDATQSEILSRPALVSRGEMVLFVQIAPDGSALPQPPSADQVELLQRERWATFWARSSVTLPPTEELWQERYQASLFYVAQSIGDGPTHPTGLSKPNYPHWYGCFHDTDTYFCRPLLETGRPELPLKHLTYRYRCLDRAREYAAESGFAGAHYPWQSDLSGNADGVGPHSVMNGAIIAREAFFQASMGGNEKARQMAAEIIEETFRYLLDFIRDEQGQLQIVPGPIDTFSETMEVSKPTEAILAIRAVAESLLLLTPDSGEAGQARRVLAELVPQTDDHGALIIAPDGEPEYMRTPSVALGAFPLHIVTDREQARMSLFKELERVVFLFAWLPHQLSAAASQAGCRDGAESAAGILRAADAFYRSWHAVDEWENRRTGRADHFVTGAGAFATAIHHMLLAETESGVWELFPGTPTEWRDISFDGLITRTGWRVSATLSDGALTHVSAVPAHERANSVLRLTSAFDGPARPTGGRIWEVRL